MAAAVQSSGVAFDKAAAASAKLLTKTLVQVGVQCDCRLLPLDKFFSFLRT